jgi:hypothetical protein
MEGNVMKRVLLLNLTAFFILTSNLQSQDESYICKCLFGSSNEITRLSTDIISLAIDAVWESNGHTTGTLTQDTGNPDLWTYTATPNDKLILIFNTGIKVEFKFFTITGNTSGTDEFKWNHTMDFNTFVQNSVNLRINSYTYEQGQKVFWQRTIKGTTLYDSQNMNVDLTHNGNIEYDIGNGYAFYTYRELAAGTSITGSFSLNINEGYTRFIGNNSNLSTFVLNTQIKNNSSGNFSGTTYKYDDAFVFWAAGSVIYGGYYNKVIDASQWEARGALLKNGQHYGTVQFDGPVINGTYGPKLILHMNNGGNVLLHNLIGILTDTDEDNDHVYVNDFIIHQNYPNPFNSSTSIQYEVSGTGIISAVVYDALGREVETLFEDETRFEGVYRFSWNAKDLTGGVYFCRIEGIFPGNKRKVQTIKMILLK